MGSSYPPDHTPRPAPTLTTLHEVARILRDAHDEEGPLIFSEIARRMSAKRVRPETIRACLDELQRNGHALVSKHKAIWMDPTRREWSEERYVQL